MGSILAHEQNLPRVFCLSSAPCLLQLTLVPLTLPDQGLFLGHVHPSPPGVTGELVSDPLVLSKHPG